ncbi:MAG TPA: hypothetical protein VN231_11410 [Allosphingosinicella sp.]|nr:hypothetical protein [Allosphingosinicella sp.]
MNFSYSAVWNDTAAMLRANSSLLVAIAGAFFFLPGLLSAYFIPPPEEARDFAEMVQQMSGYVGRNWHWSLLGNLLNMVGIVAIYLLLLDPPGRTVGGALAGSVTFLPSYFLLSILLMTILGIAFLLLIVPCLYLLGRIGVAGAVMTAERRLNPVAAIGGAFARTKGRGWAVAGLILMVAAAGIVLILAIQAVLGSIFLLLGGRDGIGGLLVAVLQAALGAAYSTVLVVLLAAIYRALAAGSTSGT